MHDPPRTEPFGRRHACRGAWPSRRREPARPALWWRSGPPACWRLSWSWRRDRAAGPAQEQRWRQQHGSGVAGGPTAGWRSMMASATRLPGGERPVHQRRGRANDDAPLTEYRVAHLPTAAWCCWSQASRRARAKPMPCRMLHVSHGQRHGTHCKESGGGLRRSQRLGLRTCGATASSSAWRSEQALHSMNQILTLPLLGRVASQQTVPQLMPSAASSTSATTQYRPARAVISAEVDPDSPLAHRPFILGSFPVAP